MARTIYISVCPVCKKEFEASRCTQKYCSYPCAYSAQLERQNKRYKEKHPILEKKCIICRRDFIPNTNGQEICSDACRKVFRKKYTRKYSKTKNKKIKAAAAANAAAAHKLRMQRQAEARKLGLSYGRYIAMMGGELK